MTTTYIYGIITSSGEHIDISKNEKYTKRYATINGYDTVSRRDINHYYVAIIAKKIGNKWSNP